MWSIGKKGREPRHIICSQVVLWKGTLEREGSGTDSKLLCLEGTEWSATDFVSKHWKTGCYDPSALLLAPPHNIQCEEESEIRISQCA